MRLLDEANDSIDVIVYSFAIGSSNRRGANAPFEIASKLVELKKQRGSKIKIRVYLEGRRETAERNRVTAAFLKKAGIEIKWGSTHAKGFLVDGRHLLFGSTNLTNQSIRKNYETNLFLDDESVVDEFSDYFEHLWQGGKHGEIHLNPPMYADGDFLQPLLAAIDGSTRKIDFSIYFFHFGEIERALIRAHKRGVSITGFFHHHESFALSYVRRTRGTAMRLREGGIKKVYFGPGHLFSHSKYLVSDRKLIVLGTGNWLHEDVEIHPQLYIAFQNAKLATALARRLAIQIKHETKN
jgi:phosphatidylserine/phosphatidylglycerophosphate/cardiolipin synthase-like enzyme